MPDSVNRNLSAFLGVGWGCFWGSLKYGLQKFRFSAEKSFGLAVLISYIRAEQGNLRDVHSPEHIHKPDPPRSDVRLFSAVVLI